jgi:hypothetical protein
VQPLKNRSRWWLIESEKNDKGEDALYLVKIILAAFWVIYGWLVAVMAEMAGSDQTITP